jgi:hypothetical protein
MRMPNAERAVVEMAKLTEYCLSPDHPRGRHKARVFASVLGLTAENAEELRDALVTAADSEAAVPGDADEFGQRYVLDYPLKGPAGEGTVRSAWIIRAGENFPRLVSCYVLV